jgi:3-hydroxybutyryl-CoA dehydrogenase
LARALIQSAVLVALKDVAEPEDIDRTWMVGTGLDIGPFGLLKQIGVDNFLAISAKLPEQLKLISTEDKELVEAYVTQI